MPKVKKSEEKKEETKSEVKEKKYSFRIRRGAAVVDGKMYSAVNIKDGNPDLIYTDNDLSKHNTPGVAKKFTSADDFEPTEEIQDDDDGLDELTVDELKTHAKEEEIDLSGLTKKDEIIAKIRQVLEERESELQ